MVTEQLTGTWPRQTGPAGSGGSPMSSPFSGYASGLTNGIKIVEDDRVLSEVKQTKIDGCFLLTTSENT